MKYFVLLNCLVTLQKVTSFMVSELSSKEKTFEVENETLSEIFHFGNQKEHSDSYLDNTITLLRNNNWTEDDTLCLNEITVMIRNLQNFTLWAVWNWDSQPSEPLGMLFGSRYQLGNYDQCMNTPWSDKQTQKRTKYCLADIVLERTDKANRKNNEQFTPYQSALDFMEYHPGHTRPFNELTWGVCVPEACGPRTIERLVEVMLAGSYLGGANISADINVKDPCQRPDDHREFDHLFYSFIGLFALLIIICLICTCLNWQKTEKHLNEHNINLVSAFCLKQNLRDLLRVENESLKVLYGIRYLSICFIVLDHQLGIQNAGPISDGFTSDKATKSFLGYFVFHDDLFVDTFFFLSGCLAFITLSKLKEFPNPLLAILKRYIRLVIALAVVIFYICALFPYSGDGPLWYRGFSYETMHCRNNWWINLLMLNNYIDSENICLVSSWYIPCDFHFTVIIICWFWLYRRHPRLGVFSFAAMAVLSIIVPGIITYVNNFSPIQMFTVEFVVNPRGDKEFNVMYIKSHTRFAAYLVGVAGGYVHTKFVSTGYFKKISSKKWIITATIAALVLMVSVMVTGCDLLWRDYHPIEGAIYAALNRPAWAFGIAALVLCCSLEDVPVVKSFLSWNAWVPLSRLAYGLYLTHTLIITRNIFITRNPHHNDYFGIISSTVSVIFWGSLISLLIWLLVEAPVNNLVIVAIKARLRRKVKHADEKIIQSTQNGCEITNNC